ncbi:hypothetical protein [Altererythrobacter sp. MF3-039]|uniref:hypothetical protein n=1 Tax=Altererythrobacter sp. MF3-039 TaxID=3252901 RepID=UPI00390C4F29
MRKLLITLLSVPALTLVPSPLAAQEVFGANSGGESGKSSSAGPGGKGGKKRIAELASATARVLKAARIKLRGDPEGTRASRGFQVNLALDGRSIIEFE